MASVISGPTLNNSPNAPRVLPGTGQRVALPRTVDRPNETAQSPFDAFARVAARSTGAPMAALVLEEPSGLVVHAVSGPSNGELLPVAAIRSQLGRSRRVAQEIGDLTTELPAGTFSEEEKASGWQAYAGATIRDQAGVAVGVLCVLDRQPRRFGREALAILTDIAHATAELLAAHHATRPAAIAAGNGVTALPGRQALEQLLADTVRRQDEEGRPSDSQTSAFALFRIDVGRLAALNEMYGREIADQVLQQTADRLKAITPLRGFLAHLGGSAFALVAPGPIGIPDCEAIALGTMDRLREPVAIDSLELPLRPSCGVALFPQDGGDAASLQLAAEAALADAKKTGDGRHKRASRQLSATYALATGLEQDLQTAVTQGDFHLHWMPVIDVATERVTSFEALVRWRRPGHGDVSPALFIPVAEAGGFIEALDAWVLRAACAEASSWERELGVCVNVSLAWLSHNRLPSLLKRVLDETGLEPHRLQIELSERGGLEQDGNARRELSQVRAMGVRLALDDFGAGATSLGVLSTYPFDQVKLDSRFVQALGRDRRAEAVTRGMLHMAHELGMTTCAEGVETEEQLAFLDAHGCEEIQGYLLGRPKPSLPDAARRVPAK